MRTKVKTEEAVRKFSRCGEYLTADGKCSKHPRGCPSAEAITLHGSALLHSRDSIYHSPEYWLGRLSQAIGTGPDPDSSDRILTEAEIASQNLVAASRHRDALAVLRQYRNIQQQLHARALRANENVEAMPLVQQMRREMKEAAFMGGAPLSVKAKKRGGA